jgi:hypothetical protein
VFQKLSSNQHKLLNDIIGSNNPAELLRERLNQCSGKDEAILRSNIRALDYGGYIAIKWADNTVYGLSIKGFAYTYEEQLSEYEKEDNAINLIAIVNDNSIEIGDKNKIVKSNIFTEGNLMSRKTDNSIHVGDSNKISNSTIGTNNSSMGSDEPSKEKTKSKLFWYILIPTVVAIVGGIIVVAVCDWLGLK